MANQLLIEEVVVSRLQANAAVGADLGTSTNARIYPLVTPQYPEYPCLVYERAASDYQHNMLGDSNISMGVLELTVVGKSFLNVKNISGNIRLALSGLRGTYTVGAKSLVVQRFLISSDEDGYAPPLEGKEYGLWTNVSRYEYTTILEAPTLD